MTCCCCIPIKCGINTIGIFTVALAAIGISAQFFLILNDQVKWWYCLVNLVILTLDYIAAAYFFVWFGKDSVANRGNLACACIMVIVAAVLCATWALVYFIAIHDGDTVYYGWGTTEEGYVKYQKKYYIFRELAWCVIVVTCYAYFICVCGRYASALREDKTETETIAYKKMKARELEAEKALDEEAKNKGKKPKPEKKAKSEKDEKSEKAKNDET